MVSRCGETQDSESNAQVNYGAGPLDSSKDSTFLLAVDNTAVGECDVTHVQQDDHQTQHGNELGVTGSEFEDFTLQRELRHRGDVQGDEVRPW